MRKFDFEVILGRGIEMTEELADRLFEAGCVAAEVRLEAEAFTGASS